MADPIDVFDDELDTQDEGFEETEEQIKTDIINEEDERELDGEDKIEEFDPLEDEDITVDKKKTEVEDDDEELADEDAKLLKKTVNKETADIRQQLEEAKITSKVSEFLSEKGNEMFKPFQATIKKIALTNGLGKTLKVESIAYMVAGRQLMKMASKQTQLAGRKANLSNTSANKSAKQSTTKDPMDMSDDELKAFEMANGL